MGPPRVDIIVAVDSRGGIGAEGALPWRLEGEWRHFLRLVTRKSGPNHWVCWIMGKKSWDLHSLPGGLFEMMDQEGHKILKIVMTRRLKGKPDNHSYTADCWQRVLHVASSLRAQFPVDSFWNLGGPGVYRAQLESTELRQNTRLYLTLIQEEYKCDAFFPNLKVFGLDCVPSEHCVKSSLALSVMDAADDDVNTLVTHTEGGVTWTYRVLKFVEK